MELRYSQAKFKTTLAVAILLTVMTTGVVWMILTLFGSNYKNAVTALVALIFFVLCSVGMLWRYYRNEIVFAVRNNGMLDTRWSREILGWDEIKEVVLLRHEAEFELEIRLWPRVQGTNSEFRSVDLSPFDVAIEDVILEVEKHVSVRQELR